MGRVFSGAALAVLTPLAAAQNQVNMSPGVTEIGAEIFELHMLIIGMQPDRREKGPMHPCEGRAQVLSVLREEYFLPT